MRTMKQKVDPGFWYLADIVERSEVASVKKSKSSRRCLTWVNTLLIRAQSDAEAYDKATAIAKREYTQRYKNVFGQVVRWRVLGISSLVLIHGKLEDGAEIAWTDRGYMSAKRSQALVKSKRELLANTMGNR
jgi:hypothetical protein